ncbi:MAG TPA: HAD family hydrolase [Solirubrobacteraceae bacterium]|nr:HAD family hydrolase [Solirubrobacteraceae bacterium]
MTIRAVACDLDGTLLRSDGTLDARSHRALSAVQEAGILPVLCTARPARWIEPLALESRLSGAAVCANGAVVWDLASGEALWVRSLSAQTCATIVAVLGERLPSPAWAVERLDGFAHDPSYQPRWPVPPDTEVAPVSELIRLPAVKLLVRAPALGADELLEVARRLVGDLAHCSHSSTADSLLEIAAADVDKGSGLAWVCERHGIEPREVVAFGDMPNDLPMLRWAGHAVAVANAHPDVLEAADEVTASNDDAGVARVLERLVAEARRASLA